MSSFNIGELHAKPERKAELLESFKMLQTQPGFIAHTIYQSDEDENMLITVEEWESAEGHANFLKSLPEGSFEEWTSMLSQPPKSTLCSKLS